MKYSVRLFVLIFIFCSVSWGRAESDAPPNKNESVFASFPKLKDERGYEYLADKSGTAFLVHPSGVVITCTHCVPDGDSGVLKDRNGRTLPFRLITRVPQYDLAFLRVSVPSELQSLPLNVLPSPNKGDSWTGIGSLQNQLTPLQGKFAEIKGMITEMCCLENVFNIEMNSAPGCSGGPVFDQEENVVGIIQAGVYEKNNITAAIPAEYVETACREVMNLRAFKGLTLGLIVETRKDGLFVTKIDPDSDAKTKGISEGDKITSIGPWTVTNAVDYYLSEWAWGMERSQKKLSIKFLSKTKEETIAEITLTKKMVESDQETPKEKLKPGCPFEIEFYDKGSASFLSPKPKAEGWTNLFEIGSLRQSRMTFRGLLEIPRDGSYGFHLVVPGSGKLTIGPDFLVEKTSPHPRMPVLRRGYFAKGLHRFVLVIEASEPPRVPYLFIDSTEEQETVVPISATSIFGIGTQDAP